MNNAVPDRAAYKVRFRHITRLRFGNADKREQMRSYKHRFGLSLPGTFKLLEEVGHLLDAANISWWLSYGALLGVIRNGKFIEGDVDLDIVIAESHNGHDVEAALTRGGGVLLNRITYGREIFNENYWYKGIYVDFYYAKDFHGRRVVYGRFAGCIFLLEHDRQPTKLMRLENATFRVPVAPDPYLTKLYGPGWPKPDSQWRWYLQQTPVEIWGDPFHLAHCYYRREIRKA